MYLTTTCQKTKTYNAILTTNVLTVTAEPVKDMKPVKK